MFQKFNSKFKEESKNKLNNKKLKINLITALIACNFLVFTSKAELVIFAEGMADHGNLIADFELQTGEKVIITDSSFADNLESLKNYSDPKVLAQPNSLKPDLFITKDITYFSALKSQGFTQSMDLLSEFELIKTGMMDSIDQHWVGLTFRARTLVFRSGVDVSAINTYSDLAKPEFEGYLCLRKADNSYNYGLVSYLIEQYGEADAETILLGWMTNLAQPIDDKKGDSVLIKDVSAGLCDLALVNHYYLAREYQTAEAEQRKMNVNVKYLNQGQGGVHVNGFGVAFLKTSQQKDLAQKFVKMLLSEKAQTQIATAQFAFPTISTLADQVMNQGWGKFNYDPANGWGPFEASPLVWSKIGENLNAAKQLMLDTQYMATE